MRAKEFITETDHLNELREYLDMSQYGAWLNTNGEIIYVDAADPGHSEWVWDTYHSEDYLVAYDDGWIRVISDNDPTSFQLNGHTSDITQAFKYWWPSAIKTNKFWIETEDTDKWYEYKMPRDRIKVQRDFGPRQ